MAFRPNVAGIFQRPDGAILIAERIDCAGAWQFPQGGVDDGEELEVALRREMLEELGVADKHYRIGARFGPYQYRFPRGMKKRGFHGQQQHCFLLPFVGDEAVIRVETHVPEFRAVRWIPPAEFELCWVPEFKQAVFQQIFADVFGLTLA